MLRTACVFIFVCIGGLYYVIISPMTCVYVIKQLYDIPENSLIRVRVHTADDYAVESIMIGDTVLSFNEATGYYETAASYDDDVVVSITLKDATPEWGLRRESY